VIFHLAALLSTRAEFTPETAHEVNVRGTLNLLKLAVEQVQPDGAVRRIPVRVRPLRKAELKQFQADLSGEDRITYLVNGGQQTLESYMNRPRSEGEPAIPSTHLEFFKSLRIYYETPNYIFVHAGLKNKVPLEKQKTEDLLWIRRRFIESKYDYGKMVVFGHTPLHEPLLLPNKIGIDTGAVYGGPLTAIRLPDETVFQAW
jgi:diadenosine tetraphosphatase ApaH/serine/threonine PP2A family protein phosphatase